MSTVSQFPNYPVLIVTSESEILDSYDTLLRANAFTNIIGITQSADVSDILSRFEIEVIIMDHTVLDVADCNLLDIIVENYPHIPVVIILEEDDVAGAITYLNHGVFDVIVKPMDLILLVPSIFRAIDRRTILQENAVLKKHILSKRDVSPSEAFAPIITVSEYMRSIFRYIQAVAPTKQPILIYGETGVGKESIASAIAALSNRSGQYITVNVAGLDDNMFSDALFGHCKGAFTGAIHDRGGFIEKAAEGTLFLDEIGDLSMASQVKLLRLLQENEYYALGSDELKRTTARIIVATNRNLYAMQQEGKFRNDLYYRLNAHQITIPPLRERLEDIPLLVDFFLKQAAEEFKRSIPHVPKQLFDLLRTYSFPGNIRELRSMVYDAISNSTSHILSLDAFKQHISSNNESPPDSAVSENGEEEMPLIILQNRFPTLKEANQYLISEALLKSNGNQTVAAQLLGLTQQALSSRLKKIRQDQ